MFLSGVLAAPLSGNFDGTPRRALPLSHWPTEKNKAQEWSPVLELGHTLREPTSLFGTHHARSKTGPSFYSRREWLQTQSGKENGSSFAILWGFSADDG